MDLRGCSLGSAAMFLLAVLTSLVSLAESYGSYNYEFVPRVDLIFDKKVYASMDGIYLGGSTKKLVSKQLIFVEDPYFGCTELNQTDTPPSYSANAVFLLPDTSHCSLYEKTRFASNLYDADGMLFYRPSSQSDVNASVPMTYTGPTEVTSESRKRQTRTQSVPVIRLTLMAAQLAQLSFKQSTGSALQVTINFELRQRQFNTSSTFYFVVFAFCILMMLSCSWLLLSYFKRCHYRWRVRRNQARSANETREMVNRLPTKSYKLSKETGEVPTCVVCLEAFKNHDSIRILPCKHEFHRKCVDPWLKMKRSCPMCKQDISPPKRRQSSSSRSHSNSERRAARASVGAQEQTAVLATTNEEQRERYLSENSNGIVEDNVSIHSSSSISNSSQGTDTSASPLLGDAAGTSDNGGTVAMMETEGEELDGGGEEMTVIDIEDAPSTVDGLSAEEGEHIRVDIEGGIPIESDPAPVVNA